MADIATFQRRFGVFISYISYISLIFLFARALLLPASNINFIFNAGFFVFISEFFSIHSAGFLAGAGRNLALKLGLVAFYTVFLLAFTFFGGSLIPALVFGLSLLAKALRPADSSNQTIWGHAMLFLFSVFLISMLGGLIAFVFPFSQALLAHKPHGTSGLFVDTPQVLLVWGIVYYSLLMTMNIWYSPLITKIKATLPANTMY